MRLPKTNTLMLEKTRKENPTLAQAQLPFSDASASSPLSPQTTSSSIRYMLVYLVKTIFRRFSSLDVFNLFSLFADNAQIMRQVQKNRDFEKVHFPDCLEMLTREERVCRNYYSYYFGNMQIVQILGIDLWTLGNCQLFHSYTRWSRMLQESRICARWKWLNFTNFNTTSKNVLLKAK